LQSEPLPFVRLLGLCSEKEIIAFLELYGYFLGDGSLEFALKGSGGRCVHDALVFSPVKNVDVEFLLERFAVLGLQEQVTFYHNKPTARTVQHRFGITAPAWTTMFRAQYQHKYKNWPNALVSIESEMLIPTDPQTIASGKWFWWWCWRLSKEQMRAVLTGLVFADGTQNAKSPGPLMVYTSSVPFRDQIIRAALHAGYSATFRLICKAGSVRGNRWGRDIISTRDHWRVTFTTDSGTSEPIMRNAHIKHIPYNGRTWCVTMPHGFIWVRRAITNAEGVVIKASRPTIVGNCDQMGNKGAFCDFTREGGLKPKLTSFAHVPHPPVKPMQYASSMSLLGM